MMPARSSRRLAKLIPIAVGAIAFISGSISRSVLPMAMPNAVAYSSGERLIGTRLATFSATKPRPPATARPAARSLANPTSAAGPASPEPVSAIIIDGMVSARRCGRKRAGPGSAVTGRRRAAAAAGRIRNSIVPVEAWQCMVGSRT